MKKEMLINVLQPEECRIAIIEDGVLEELYVERTSHESYTGNIYKGKVVNLEPAIQAGFVDFSVGRNGFLHVSDVEPQYYPRHQPGDDSEPGPREPRREREERRRGRSEDRERDPGASAPPQADERQRERPDRSERGRRDRSEPRRFGEGLTDDEWLPPPPPVPVDPLLGPTAEQDEPRSAWPAVSAPSPPEEPPARPIAEPEPGLRAEEEPPLGWSDRPVEPFDPDLPPSRTQRFRSQPPAVPSPEVDAEATGRAYPYSPSSHVELTSEHPAPGETRKSRGRGRQGRPVPEPEAASVPEPESPAPESPLEPAAGDRREHPKRRGGRAAIRSRGGEREVIPERPRAAPPERHGSRPPVREPLLETDTERVAGAEPDRTRERLRDPDSVREPEGDSPRERGAKPHDRAGEPGYVPRRERSRAPSTGPTPDFPSFGWSDVAFGSEAETEPETESLTGESTPTVGKLDGPRRRRRRRGRRRESGRQETQPSTLSHLLGPESEDRALHTESRFEQEPAKRGPEAEGTPLLDEFDFSEEVSEPEYEEDLAPEELREEPAATTDEAIDPELEEEIRREIEEIAVLEREMGLRGPAEARPRRGDERETEAGRGGRNLRGRGLAKPPIQEIFRRGDEVLVQVIKESIGTKGPTLSTYISIPGRYLVLMPGLNRVGVSRKIADEAQRRKLREIMSELNPPKGLGFIVRTAGLERTKRELARDLAYLLRLWKVILRRIKKSRAPAVIYQESDMITRTIRDIFTSEIDTIWIDEPSAYERAQEFLRVVMPRYVNRLRLYDDKVPLFHKYGIEDEIAKIQRRHVPLPEGGSIVIDQTEALVAIDVNSGNFRVENDAERTAYEMNLRAAKEIARQLRLRDLGGVIVNDFIDMREERHRRGVERALRDAIKRDRARTKVLRMSAFGLIEMTRQRIRPSLKRSIYEDCPHCGGAGVVKTVESMSIDVMRLLALAAHRDDIRRVNISVSPAVATYLNNRKRRDIARIESEANMTIHLRGEENVPAEHLQIDCFDSNSSEVRLFPQAGSPHRRGH
jgi:ribonuclease E